MHALGLAGMPRRIQIILMFILWNQVISYGSSNFCWFIIIYF